MVASNSLLWGSAKTRRRANHEGEADPITPPWHAEHLSASLPNGQLLIFKGMGHGNTLNECSAKIMAQFVEAASIKDLDIECVKSVQPPPFFVNFSGPQP